MKISPKGESKYLAQIDVPSPILATIATVRIETLQNPREDKPILHFAGNNLKPMILNVTNRRVLINAWGDETDNWNGKVIEVYVNPDITNSQGEVVGGVRVRIPVAPKPPAASNTTPAPRQAPTQQAPRPRVLSNDEKHQIVIDGYRKAQTEAKVHEFRVWAEKQNFAPHHDEEQLDEYNAAMDRLGVGMAVDNSIPF
jgi:hypothetical protein